MKLVFTRQVLVNGRVFHAGEVGDFDEATARHLKGRGRAKDHAEPVKPAEESVKKAVDPKPAEAQKAVK